MAATVKSLREILLTVDPPKILVDRKTEIPILREDLLHRLKTATTREEGIAIAEEAKLDMVSFGIKITDFNHVTLTLSPGGLPSKGHCLPS